VPGQKVRATSRTLCDTGSCSISRRQPTSFASSTIIEATRLARITHLAADNITVFVTLYVKQSISAREATTSDRGVRVDTGRTIRSAISVESPIARLVGIDNLVTTSGAETVLVQKRDKSRGAGLAILRTTRRMSAIANFAGIQETVTTSRAYTGGIRRVPNSTIGTIGEAVEIHRIARFARVYDSVSAKRTFMRVMFRNVRRSARGTIAGTINVRGIAEFTSI